MPKITINEINNINATGPESTTFAVVVPGVVESGKESGFFDENNVGRIEAEDTAAFIRYIGKCAADNVVAHGPTKTAIGYESGESGEIIPVYTGRALTAEEISKYSTCIYTRAALTGAHEIGRLIELESGTYYQYTNVAIAEVSTTATNYFIIEKGNEGNNAIINGGHKGNQIAYELIKLGYPVYYKKISSTSELESGNIFECFEDKSTYPFRYITTGGYVNNVAYTNIANVAAKRGDCIALVDISEAGCSGSNIVNQLIANESGVPQSTYVAAFAPKVTYVGEAEAPYANLQFPASFHYLACAANAFNTLNFNEWYAVAGYTRGIAANTISSTTLKLGDIAINKLEPRNYTPSNNGAKIAINVVTNERGNFYLWGNRTTKILEQGADGDLRSTHFLNIRQLCSTIKQELYVACRNFTFDPNSDLLWNNFCTTIRPTLEKMKSDQGILDYKIIKETSTHKAELRATIRIVPIEAVEDFEITVVLEDGVEITE